MIKIFLLLLALIGAPWCVDNHILSILILTLYYAYMGQAWNLMIGFAGQLSFGHALYGGLGAYIAAGFLVHYNINPILSLPIVVIANALIGSFIGFLGFRFAIQGVYFSLLTIAFAECGRIIFEHWQWFGASAGLFIPISNSINLLNLRMPPYLFYYLFLLLVILCFYLCRYIMTKTRLGYYWLALREDPEAAQSLGINLLKTNVLAVSISAVLTGIGGVVYGFYVGSLFPGQTFAMTKSIELIMGPIIGGIGTLLGPILGAFILTPMGELINYVLSLFDLDLPGIKHIFYGTFMILVMFYLPKGIWVKIKPLFCKKETHNVL